MKIAICDDEINAINNFKNQFHKIRDTLNYQEEITIIEFQSGEQLLDYYNHGMDLDLIFLDVMMPGMDGIHIAELIRSRDEKVTILFLSSNQDSVGEGYRVKASNYIIKPMSESKLKEILEICILEKKNESKYIIEVNQHGLYKIYFHEIISIETIKRDTLIITQKSKYLSHKTMKQHMELLDSNFYRCHESYIVNMQCITKVDKLELILTNGNTAIIGKNRKSDFMKTLCIYYGKKALF